MNDQVVICRSNPISPDPRVEKIARSLSAYGYNVVAIGWDRDRTSKQPKEQEQDGLQITRLYIPARYGTGLMNLPALLLWQIGLFWWLVTHRLSYQVIHACDFDTILPALLIKVIWKKLVIYDIFDFYADHLRRTPDFIKRAIRTMDFWAIEKADGVILVDEARVHQIRGSHPKVCISVYNSPEDVAFQHSEEQYPSEEGTLRIAYIGLLQVERGIFEMIDVLRYHPKWHLDIAGFGGDEKPIVALAKDLSNVTWHGRVSYDRAIALSGQADVLFATYDPTIPNHHYSSPNKIFEAMMLGKPVIVAENTNMDRMIEEANCGIIVKYGDSVTLENALILLANDLGLRKTLGKNARRAYEEVYSWQKMQVRLKDFYCQILQKR
jgi:glycosyltransferase involved in cell wall biosynthesis